MVLRYIVEKGSVAIDGISLTVVKIEPWHFRGFGDSPYTGRNNNTTKKTGDQ